ACPRRVPAGKYPQRVKGRDVSPGLAERRRAVARLADRLAVPPDELGVAVDTEADGFDAGHRAHGGGQARVQPVALAGEGDARAERLPGPDHGASSLVDLPVEPVEARVHG